MLTWILNNNINNDNDMNNNNEHIIWLNINTSIEYQYCYEWYQYYVNDINIIIESYCWIISLNNNIDHDDIRINTSNIKYNLSAQYVPGTLQILFNFSTLYQSCEWAIITPDVQRMQTSWGEITCLAENWRAKFRVTKVFTEIAISRLHKGCKRHLSSWSSPFREWG